MILTASSLLLLLGAAEGRAALPLVVEGRPAAVVVTAVEPGPVAAYAARELVSHVEKATGVTLETVTENAIPAEPAGRVYIGDCRAARAAGIDATRLPPETFVLKTGEGALFIAGEDSAGDPLVETTRAGTLWGVYELLERVLNVRWLWPGELGVVVPRARTVTVGRLDERVPPRFLQRKVRAGLGATGDGGPLDFTPEAREKYRREQQVFLRRHRMGRSVELRYGHAFEHWWAEYGAQHPEWFQLREDGRRGPERPGARTSMCVSNPAFHAQVIAAWKEARAARPGEFRNINGCENDIRGLCTCAACRAWDGPQPEGVEQLYPGAAPRVVSERYARFWLALQQLAAKEDPGATVVGYAYLNYFPAPSSSLKLNEQILVGMCPWPGFWYPRPAAEREWLKQQWAGWRATGARLFLRPNYFLDGYCMPHLFPREFADEFQFSARHGMVATDFDSLTGQWSTQGPNLYLLARMHVRPEKPVEELLDEYYTAFGPAADAVRGYFAYWEKHVAANSERLAQPFAERGLSRYRQYAKIAHEFFPPASFEPAQALLAQAAQATARDPEAAARVDFLQKGLRHARLCARVAAVLAEPEERRSPAERRKALEELIAFRRGVEHEGIANLAWLARVEERSWNVKELLAP